MKKADFLFEIGIEELPAGLISGISEHIKAQLSKKISENDFACDSIEILSTPRRLFYAVKNLDLESADKELEIKGPPEKVALKDGTYTQAALGFAKKNGVTEADIYIQDGYLYVKQFIKGLKVQDILEQEIPNILSSVPGERFMRTANGDVKFSRPMLWLAAVLNASGTCTTLNFELEELKSSNISYGHRFLGPDSFEITSAQQYVEQLKKQGVWVRPEERKEAIRLKAHELAMSINADVDIDEDLLDEVIGLIEHPAPVLCSFPEQYLKIPEPVLITVMAAHQRYFPLYKKGTRELLPNFITVSNNPLEEAKANIQSGNEKVIVPRFKDAEFFVEEDAKLNLDQRLEKLEKINSQVGTMRQKVTRMQKIVSYLAREIKDTYNDTNPAKKAGDDLNEAIISDVLEAALLCKSDLTTHLVFEFTELQGEIGGIYAAAEGKSETIAAAIADHYKPRFAGDELPASIGSKLISVADKLDNLVQAFALGKIPKGSADPFALRRQANGMLEIILHSHLIINIEKLVDYVIDLGEAEFGAGRMIKKTKGRGDKQTIVEVPEFDWSTARVKLQEFLAQRMPFVFDINHKDTTANKAVLATGNILADLNRKHMFIHFISEIKSKPEFAELKEVVTRLANITKSDEISAEPVEEKFVNDYEKQVLAAFKPLEDKIDPGAAYELELKHEQLFEVIKPVNEFFDNVLVNDEDEAIRANRKALVGYGANLFREIADFSLV